MDVQIKLTAGWAGLPKRATGKSFGYDLQTVEQASIAPHTTVVLKTGVVLANDLPFNDTLQNVPMDPDTNGSIKFLGAQEGVAMLVLPRSSLPLKHGLIVANSPGLIDADYSGEIGLIVHNVRDEWVHIETGIRLAQLVFVKLLVPTITEVTTLDASRTRGGMGSTGL